MLKWGLGWSRQVWHMASSASEEASFPGTEDPSPSSAAAASTATGIQKPAGEGAGADAGQGAPQGQGLADPSAQEAEGRSVAKEDGEPFFTSDEILEMFRAGYSFDEIKQLEQMG